MIVVAIIIISVLSVVLYILCGEYIYRPSFNGSITPNFNGVACRTDDETLKLITTKFSTSNYIPNNIFQVWIPFTPENDTPPPYYRQMMDTVIKNNKGWDIFFVGPKSIYYIWSTYHNYDHTMELLYYITLTMPPSLFNKTI